MLRFKSLRAVMVSLLAPISALATDGWSQIKVGMTRGETTAVLGTELVASRGRGFEVAIYDSRAEIVYLHGQVVAWTAPASSQVTTPSSEAWQFDQVSRARAGVQPSRRSIEVTPATHTRAGAILPAYRL